MDSQVPPNPKQSDSVGTHLLPDLLGIILTSSPSSQLVFHTSLRRMGNETFLAPKDTILAGGLKGV